MKPPKLTTIQKRAIERFRREVCEQATYVDPSGERDWFSMAIGYFVGVGLTMDEAFRCATEAQFKEYWS